MNQSAAYGEIHRTQHVGWLRASVMGANDGIVSTASLVLGVASAGASSSSVMLAGLAGMVAGAMSMAAGEYVSVSSQSDTERADLKREQRELDGQPDAELNELTAIYLRRGLSSDVARKVAEELTRHDALGSHARDELGISGAFQARPLQAALSSAISFAIGASMPLLVILLTPRDRLGVSIAISSLVLLGVLGSVAARVGGANGWTGAARVLTWGALAMALTAAIGSLFGTTV